MSDELLDTLSIIVGAPALAIILLIATFTGMGSIRRVFWRRYNKELAQLQEFPYTHSGSDQLAVDWIHYKHVPKSQIFDVLSKYGWRYTGQQYGNQSWMLYFSREPHNQTALALERLATELTTSTLDEHYLDTSQYMDLDTDTIDHTIMKHGWHEKKRTFQAIRWLIVLTRTPHETTN